MRSEILEEKWRTQAKMASAADYDVRRLLKGAKETVEKMRREENFKANYAEIHVNEAKQDAI